MTEKPMDGDNEKLKYICPLTTCERCEEGIIALRSYESGNDYIVFETPCPYFSCRSGYIAKDEV